MLKKCIRKTELKAVDAVFTFEAVDNNNKPLRMNLDEITNP